MLQNKRIRLEDFNSIISWAIEYSMPFAIIEGTLLDSAVINTGGKRLIKGGRKTKFILLIDEYANPWSSTLKLVFTDSEKKVRDFIKCRTDSIDEFNEKLDLLELY